MLLVLVMMMVVEARRYVSMVSVGVVQGGVVGVVSGLTRVRERLLLQPTRRRGGRLWRAKEARVGLRHV